MLNTVDQLADLIRFIADDQESQFLDTAVQMPPINQGWREFQRRFTLAGSSIMRNTVLIAVPANMTDIIRDPATTPHLPDDFVLPYTVEERPSGQACDFAPMDERSWLHGVAPRQTLGIWLWETNRLKFVGATQAVEIRLKYDIALDPFIDVSDEIPIPFAIDAIAWCVLFVVALARGASDTYRDRCSTMADRIIGDMTSISVKRDQMQRRARPPHAAWRF